MAVHSVEMAGFIHHQSSGKQSNRYHSVYRFECRYRWCNHRYFEHDYNRKHGTLIDAFSISPSTSVEANVTLEMVYSASDIDAETLTASFTWVDDTGALLGSNSTLTIDNGRPVGSTITATITVTDNYGGSDTTSETITILNTDPTVSSPASISASPSPITTGVLTCSASFSDYNDGSLTPTYSWTLSDGTPLAAIGDTLTIDSSSTNPTDEIFCTASATDNDGAPISSTTSVTVENTSPPRLMRLASLHRQVLKPMPPWK